jgi:hypothetical protein
METTMTDITYDNVAAPAPAAAQKPARQSVWRRMLEAMIDARMRQAERIVKEYREMHTQL